MQTRSQTIAELRKENEMLKLMIFGGELGKGSIFSSVGFVEQLERKDAEMEVMQKELDALKVKCEHWEECYKMQQKETDIEHQRYLEYLEKHSEVQDELDDLRSRQESKDIVFLNPAADEYIKMIKVQHAEEIKTWSDTLDDHHVHYDILKKKYDDIEERYEVMEQTWISEDDADNIHDDYLESIDELKEKLASLEEDYEFGSGLLDVSHKDFNDMKNKLEEQNQELKMELDDMKCIALVNWSAGFLTWDYDNRKPVAKVGKYHNIEKDVPEDWVALLDTLN